MEGSKRRSGPTAEDPFFKMSDPVPKFTSKKFKKSVDKPEYMSIIVYVRKRYGKYLMKEEETMTIREYIDTLDEEERDEIAETLYHCMEDDFDDFSMWAIENGIDLDATETVLGQEVPVLTLWAYDMCGD
jgi:K+/H+ antiporter YhaU regulatory subunit KhtT